MRQEVIAQSTLPAWPQAAGFVGLSGVEKYDARPLRSFFLATGRGWHREALLDVRPSSIRIARYCFFAAWAMATSGFCFQTPAPSLDFVL